MKLRLKVNVLDKFYKLQKLTVICHIEFSIDQAILIVYALEV